MKRSELIITSEKIPSKKLGQHFTITNYMCSGVVVDDKTELVCRVIDILQMLADGKTLPRVIEYDGVVYKNNSRSGKNMMYIGENKDEFKMVLFFTPDICDKDILTKRISIIEM